MKKTIAVDLDGVIHKYSKGFHDGTMYDEPMEGARKILEKLVKTGYKIVIFTTRLNPCFDEENKAKGYDALQDILHWLDKYSFIKNIHYHEITNNKPKAFAYVDDRAIRFTSWQDIKNYFI